MADQTLSSNKAPLKPAAAGTLGTFAGVFTPSVLTILGIILFLRLGYVTGSAGIGRALLIIALANIISILTSQSLAAIATNLKVKGGGDYYLISRTLGHQFGGAIGMVLYLAQSVSVAFYCIGFAEALAAMEVTPVWMSPRVIASMAVGLLFILAWLGADWATRFQYGVMTLLVAALFSFFLGGLMQWESTTFSANWTAPDNAPPFWVIFGIFFPAVTGFTQGVSMSGDLKDPGKSLPSGTFLAVGVSILVYFAMAIIFAGVLTNQTMMTDYHSIKQVARYGFLIDAGVIAATLSSAMASFLGGPRILQSLAADRIFPFLTPFSKGAAFTGNPRRAVLLTSAIALAVVGMGQLNLVARIVSMFFLISYGLLNYATYYEARAASPSFRPRFRWFNKHLSLLGFVICLGVILALDVKNGLIALAILLAIHQYLRHAAGPSRWADGSRDHAFQEIRRQLLAATGQPDHHRNWRPFILAFTNHAQRRIPLLTFAHWIEGRSGLVTAVRIIEGSAVHMRKLQQEACQELSQDIADHQLNAFPLVLRTDEVTVALPTLLQSYGIGPLQANVVLTNWYGQSGTGLPGLAALKFGRNLRTAFRHGYNLVLLHFDTTKWQELLGAERDGRRIDVWWCADASSRLMLLFAYLMTRHKAWQKADIRVLTTGTGQRLAQAKETMVKTLEESRIDAQPHIVTAMDTETIKATSGTSSLVFLPFAIKDYNLTDRRGYSLQRILPNLPTTALVMAAEAIDLDAEPEEGAAGELAAAMDRLQEAERRLIKAEKTADRTRRNLERLKAKFDSVATDGSDPEILQGLSDRLYQVEQDAEEAFRKAAKNKAKAEDAAETVIRLGGSIEEKESPGSKDMEKSGGT
jgi:amino acid transporter